MGQAFDISWQWNNARSIRRRSRLSWPKEWLRISNYDTLQEKGTETYSLAAPDPLIFLLPVHHLGHDILELWQDLIHDALHGGGLHLC